MSRIRFAIVVVVVTLWLPLQAVAAVAMPFCEQAAAGAGDSKAMHGHHHTGHNGDGVAGHTGGSGGLQCNDCGPCHLACAPMMAIGTACPLITLSFDFSPLLQTPPSAFTLEQPNPPPLA